MKRFSILCLLLVLTLECMAQPIIHVAVISDGPQFEFTQIKPMFRDELVALTKGEFSIVYKEFEGRWTLDSIRSAFNDAYNDPEVDLVIGLGITGNQMMVSSPAFPKPTFLPLVFDAQMMGAPSDGGNSGKKNLNYLAERISLADELRTYQSVYPFNNAVILIDGLVLDAVPQMREFARLGSSEADVSIEFLGHDGQDHEIDGKISADVEAVLYAAMPRLPSASLDRLIEQITTRRLPTFSLSDRSFVDRGMLAADTVDSDWQRLARRNALNIQAVLLGERAQDQPIFFQGKQELTINMETARRIGLSPRFDVLSEANLLNDEPEQLGPEFDLGTIARAALATNLDLRAETVGVSASAQSIREVRSALLPQLGVSSQQLRRRVTPTVRAGGLPERSTDASVNFSQTLYSDDNYANLDIQRLSQAAIDAGLDSSRLDLILDSTLAYLDVLQAENQLANQQDNLSLTKSNLDLARDRVRIGTSTATDVYRWQSNLALARSDLIRARAQVDQAREALNQILNLQIDSVIRLKPATEGDAFAISPDRFDEIVENPRAYGWVTDLSIANGLAAAPELEQFDAQIAAKQREIRNGMRDFWLPDFSLDSQYSNNLAQSGIGAGGLSDEEHDWVIGINASLPLFSGGRRRAALSRNRLELQQLELQRDATIERIEQQVRAAMHDLYASYANITLSQEAAEAATKTLELVTDAYAQGSLGILDVLDAQSQKLSADLSAKNSVYVFLSDAVRLQRASVNFEFLLPPDEAAANSKQLEDYLNSRRAEFAPE